MHCSKSEEWLHYRRTDQEQDVREDQKRMEQALATLDVVMSRLYEDYVLGEISKEKYKKMTADYEAEQERLKLEIAATHAESTHARSQPACPLRSHSSLPPPQANIATRH